MSIINSSDISLTKLCALFTFGVEDPFDQSSCFVLADLFNVDILMADAGHSCMASFKVISFFLTNCNNFLKKMERLSRIQACEWDIGKN